MVIDKLSDVSPLYLKDSGIKLIVLDLDNTLSPYGDFYMEKTVLKWIAKAKKISLEVVVVSNTWSLRGLIARLIVKVPLFYMAMKPFPFALWKILTRYGYSPEDVCIIGDQLFTDVLMARLAGASFVLVKPLSSRDGPHTRLFRILEKSFIGKYFLSKIK